jgi:hypothetical protein
MEILHFWKLEPNRRERSGSRFRSLGCAQREAGGYALRVLSFWFVLGLGQRPKLIRWPLFCFPAAGFPSPWARLVRVLLRVNKGSRTFFFALRPSITPHLFCSAAPLLLLVRRKGRPRLYERIC